MNLKLENNPTVAERQEIAETQELYNAKYTAFFKRETQNQIMFRQLNLEKPTKWFMNLANDQKDAESPTLKLRKYCDKYKNTPEWGKKFEEKEVAHNDMFDHFKNIFDERKREQGETIGKFLGEIQNNPETQAKKLTELEREAKEKEVTLEELRESLEDANAGKTPGIDGVDKDFLVRFWTHNLSRTKNIY